MRLSTASSTERRFGRLTAIRPAPIPHHPRYGPWWVFSCDHGGNPQFGPPRLVVRLRHRVAVEGLQSCGCLRSTTHGDTVGVAQSGQVPTEYSVWTKMRHRYNPDVCDAWQDYATFLRDVGRCPDGWRLRRAEVATFGRRLCAGECGKR